MKDIQQPDSEASRLAWHPAFFQAMRHELFEYRDSLEFRHEYQLTAEPLRIDLLIVKKPKELVIDKNIARIFKTDNIIEYKSPEDYLSVNDFLKVYAYANLYAAITPGVELSDITITLIGNRCPRKLLKYLTGIRHYWVEETSRGIYKVSGDYIPIQIIESKKLSASENVWLKSLTKDLQVHNLKVILETGVQRKETMSLDAYIDVLVRTNPDIFLEVQKMAAKTKRRTFEEVFTEAGIIPEWMERGRVKGKAEGKTEGRAEERQYVLELLDQGLSVEELKQKLCG